METAAAVEGDKPLGELVILDNSRFDIPDENVTVLGATLFTGAPAPELLDEYYSTTREVCGLDAHSHIQKHHESATYLTDTINAIRYSDPSRAIIVLTHHGPCSKAIALGLGREDTPDEISYRYTSDLTDTSAWKSTNVMLWAFGGTHFNCDYVEVSTLKRVYSNQRGYIGECEDFDVGRIVDVTPPY